MSDTANDSMLVAGIDVGSSAIKIVLMEETAGEQPRVLVGRNERIRRRDPKQVVDDMFEQSLAEANVSRDQFGYIATTGEGELVGFRTGHFYSMTTHSRGGLFIEPEARAVIDIGALHARAVLIDERAKCRLDGGSVLTSQLGRAFDPRLQQGGAIPAHRLLNPSVDHLKEALKQIPAVQRLSQLAG